MRGDEARELLGFPLNSHLSSSQIKAAYKRKAWETHPDRFPPREKFAAESKFKLISEAYTCLLPGAGHGNSAEAMHVRVVRKGVPIKHRASSALVKLPFLVLIFGTLTLGGLNASRAYRRQKEVNPSISKNPFLP